MEKKYDYAVVIGRFQPFHNAHQELIKQALAFAEKAVVVLGSARSAPDVRNPFTPAMRERMIRAAFEPEKDRLIFRAVRDYPYNDNFWITEIQNQVREAVEDDLELANATAKTKGWQDRETNEPREYADARLALVGHFKDRTSYYLNLFPQWSFEDFYVGSPELSAINASAIREQFFAGDDAWKKSVPATTAEFLDDFRRAEFFAPLESEYQYLAKYREDTRFVGVPFEPVFVTTDAVVVQSGHVLVVKRRGFPGKNLLALPGGFLQPALTLEDSAIKELKDETAIKVPVSVLKGSIKNSRVFDHPERSLRGRTVTFAYLIELQPSLEKGLPHVKGGTDASKALWLPLSALGENEDRFFEDHISIIRYFLGL
jgi:bifunctional NMN adenylyltransferase/nudix hydrolase